MIGYEIRHRDRSVPNCHKTVLLRHPRLHQPLVRACLDPWGSQPRTTILQRGNLRAFDKHFSSSTQLFVTLLYNLSYQSFSAIHLIPIISCLDLPFGVISRFYTHCTRISLANNHQSRFSRPRPPFYHAHHGYRTRVLRQIWPGPIVRDIAPFDTGNARIQQRRWTINIAQRDMVKHARGCHACRLQISTC